MIKPSMECPICNSNNTQQDVDFTETMRNCNDCGSEWNLYDEVLYNGLEKWN